MKYLKTLLVFLVVIISDVFFDSLSQTTYYYLFYLSISIVLILGIEFLFNFVISTFQEIKQEAKKITFYIDLALLGLSSMFLFWIHLDSLLFAWIIPTVLTLFIGLLIHFAIWKLNRK